MADSLAIHLLRTPKPMRAFSLSHAWLAAAVALTSSFEVRAADAPLSFNRDIRPILSSNCFYCHGHDESHREADLRLDLETEAHRDRDGSIAFKPHDLDGSAAWARINAADDDERMPPPGSKRMLTPEQKNLLRRWIEDGAPYEDHWAFQPIQSPPIPSISESSKARNPIDAFILARLEREGLKPSPEADRETLIRRVTFDLTGLPPTLSEVDAYLNDSDDNAYEKVVDRLLSSPKYAERMALAWLDAARYADSSGLHADGERDMWGWRDWVIQAFNTNLSFDQFTIEQLAGDLISNATVVQRTASAFNRNHCTSDEFGAIDEELRFQNVVDRVQTTSAVWLGLTMECAQCHDHKFDLISHKDYYRFFAYFNQTTDPGMQSRKGNSGATVAVVDPLVESAMLAAKRRLSELEPQLTQRRDSLTAEFESWLKAQRAVQADARLTIDPAVHYSLDEDAGNAVVDAVDAQRRGMVEGNVIRVDGKIAGALQFDGEGSVDLGDVVSIDRARAFSLSLWVKPDSSLDGALIARLDEEAGYRGFDLTLQNGRLFVDLIHHWPDNAIAVATLRPVEANRWQYIFVTYDGSSKAAGINVYIDGVEQSLKSESDTLSDTIHAEVPFRLGRRQRTLPFKGLLDEIRLYDRQLTPTEVLALAAGIWDQLALLPPEKQTSARFDALRNHFCETEDEVYRNLANDIAALKARVEELSKPVTTVMVMQEMATPRPTYVYDRGVYSSPLKNEIVTPGVPNVLPPRANDAPANRLGLARWLVDSKNPLTARVVVNRYWQMLFGTGIVSTVGDFGTQGAWPSHPELLDWLAADFRDHGWDTKRAIKQMVMSATYRQAAAIKPEAATKDPENRLLSRGPRFRLQAEFIRDQALAISGLLHDRVGGPSVKPYQPDGLWEEVALLESPKYVQDHGENLYRRSMYTYWKRSALVPNMQAFDATNREHCTLQRQRTNTPLQALVTLNDPQFVEAARAFAERIVGEGGTSVDERIKYAYRCATARQPSPETIGTLRKAFEDSLEVFRKDAVRAQQLLSVGESKRDEKLTLAEHAAWTIVASMILNLDETLSRG